VPEWNNVDTYSCSSCGGLVYVPAGTDPYKRFRRCRLCGAEMKKEEDMNDPPLPPSTKDQRPNILGIEPCECGSPGRNGILFPCDTDTGFVCVSACDQCRDGDFDDVNAAIELSVLLMKLDPRYIVAHMVLPGMKWEDLGASKMVVMRRDTIVQGAFYPISIQEGDILVKELKLYEGTTASVSEEAMLLATDHGDECPLCECGTVEHVDGQVKCRGECGAVALKPPGDERAVPVAVSDFKQRIKQLRRKAKDERGGT
jgi:hypothetical protein